jgi:hypothetical protein
MPQGRAKKKHLAKEEHQNPILVWQSNGSKKI